MLIEPSDRKGKRFKATYANGKVVHFGAKNGSTYIDHKDKTKRENYIKRHAVRENFDDPYSAGSLSRWLLWGDFTTLEKNHRAFMKRYPITYEK
jgi:hypothetical protein